MSNVGRWKEPSRRARTVTVGNIYPTERKLQGSMTRRQDDVHPPPAYYCTVGPVGGARENFSTA
jgi:hypothetical protein